MSFNLVEMDAMVSIEFCMWWTMVSRSFAYAISCAVGRGCYLFFAIVHQCCLSQYGCVDLSKHQQLLLTRLCLWFCWCLSLYGSVLSLYGFALVIVLNWGRVVHFSFNRLKYIFLFVIQLPSVKAHSSNFQRALISSKGFCCTWLMMKEDLAVCIGGAANVCISCVCGVFGELTYFSHSWQCLFSWRFKKRYTVF